MSTVDITNVEKEWVRFWRNADILTITERGVTTATATGTFAGDSTLTIARTNVKNVRSVVVGATTLVYGQDYTYNEDYRVDPTLISEAKKCLITFAVAQTGAYTVTYDYGSDKIYSDMPRGDLSISSYPRIGCFILNNNSTPIGYAGGSVAMSTEILLSFMVFANSIDKLNSVMTLARSKVKTAQNSFYYMKTIIPSTTGPIVEDPNSRQEILYRAQDFRSILNVER